MFWSRWTSFLVKVLIIFAAGLVVQSRLGHLLPLLAPNNGPSATDWTNRYADTSALKLASLRVSQILRDDDSVPWLECPVPIQSRYQHLRAGLDSEEGETRKYFFALDLHQCADKTPSLLGAIVQSVHFLGPRRCVVSVVEGRSTDGTREILTLLRGEMEVIGTLFYLHHNDDDPSRRTADSRDRRLDVLADLRNQALRPMIDYPGLYAPDASILFINDVVLCAEDILELLHQRIIQHADMTCAMDWTYAGKDPTFYDVWIARGMTGDTFFEIPEDGSYDSAWDLFWNDPQSGARFNAHQSFQVFACWNGATVFTSRPVLENGLRFRSPSEGECYQGEPQLFCKDMWTLNYGKIAVIPTVNLEYSLEASQKIKKLKGFVGDWIFDGDDVADEEIIVWDEEPPAMVKCMPDHLHQSWLPWNESLSKSKSGL